MSWRTVVITKRCKLDLKMGYLVVRSDEVTRIFIDEIALLLIENPAVSFTGILLEALIKKKVRVIFCDSSHSPAAELAPYYGSFDSARKLEAQIHWTDETKGSIWTEIITDKLRKQADFLGELNYAREPELIRNYIEQIEIMDSTNREGHAAKVYFNALFGMDFSRSEESPINAALNYGYGLILSAFNRAVTANGYLTQLGLKHCNMFNQFNLSSDLMEPFRILVDREVKALPILGEFGTSEKHALVCLLSESVRIDGTLQTVLNAINIYTRSVFDALNDGDPSLIKPYQPS